MTSFRRGMYRQSFRADKAEDVYTGRWALRTWLIRWAIID
jgi:hypothetical protein